MKKIETILDALPQIAGKRLYIWGAGKFGIPLANYLRKHDVNVLGIIDNKMAGKCIDGFQVTLIDEVPEYAKIFIAVSNKRFNTEILQQISDADKSLTAIRYEELYEEDMNI